ncbi:alpha-galactosidase [Acidipila sp. EB88]|uniref:alpha-galactosidase n=1 Tax=Acidipila sp. EB88 TaxID=2305226 RepID=UPI000F5E62CD|nr:alpha-galactosidase [Acidipila sp. EB88]RRA49829.1 PKD domain-containing protein [Acidipila sp. EB88]
MQRVLYLALSATACLLASSLQARAQLAVTVHPKDGSYSIDAPGISGSVLAANPAVRVDGKWFNAQDYPKHEVSRAAFNAELGAGTEQRIVYSGLQGAPDLTLSIRTYANAPFGDMQLTARNAGGSLLNVQAFRLIHAAGPEVIHLGGDAAADRVLSDSFSEDRPGMQLRDLGDPEAQVHRAVGSQLIYNQQTRQSWFIGALTSDKFLSVLRLHMAAAHGAATNSYEVDATGTTELLKENSLLDSSEEDRVELSLPLAAGAELASERLLFGVSTDYHHQLDVYGRLIRDMHHARVSAPTPLGWWSWTAYYFGLNEGTALTNASWLAQNLEPLGFTFFHLDEGYQYARGEYATADAALFPEGMQALERTVAAKGLTPGVWTAPFEVAERSWVYEHHPEWLVHNAKGAPIHIGLVAEGKDHLFALDTTNPDAQAYLRKTYTTLVNDWGVRYIKMDFMEDSAIEGYYHVPHTTALEAQRIGLQTVRDAVGEAVLLDKDGSELLNPVGIVDIGRISQDTGHTFSASRDAAPGIAARYYMNRNYFVADPDAFSVSTQTVDDQSWHGGEKPLTLDEAKVSIALTAVSGGMFEIGDDLPTLGEAAERLALVKNPDLLDMARLGKASVPLDLMSYAQEDKQPSLFLLKESSRQTIVSVFDWTEAARAHTLSREQLGLAPGATYTVADILDPFSTPQPLQSSLVITQPAHSVRMVKIMRSDAASAAPGVSLHIDSTGKAGATLTFRAAALDEHEPVLRYLWQFGDGVVAEGFDVTHAYTHAGTYTVQVKAKGLSGAAAEMHQSITVTGAIATRFLPERKERFVPTPR